MRLIIAVMVLLALMVPVQTKALTLCGCREPVSPHKALSEAVSVFSGKVTNLRMTPRAQHVFFDVDRVWKGEARDAIKVETERTDLYNTIKNSIACDGYSFEIGKHYLVYTYRDKASPEKVSRCGRTQPIPDAAEDVAALGTPLHTLSAKILKPRSAPPMLGTNP